MICIGRFYYIIYIRYYPGNKRLKKSLQILWAILDSCRDNTAMCEVQKLLPVTLSQLLCDTENLTGFAILHAEGPTSCYAVQ